jgi:ferredoxin
MSERLRVDPIACDARGQCAELFPEWITMDDWGCPIINPDVIPPGLAGHAQRAVANCPKLALRIERDRR